MSPAPSAPPPRRFLVVAEVAAMLSLTIEDVESMVGSGELPAIRVGPYDEWRVEQSVLDGFLEAKYEESRRSALWNGFDFGSITEIDPQGRRIPPPANQPDVD
ncbi:hypothetical protein GCM10025867_37040 [Frondihabitans sucicola]|uniref:DNA-binding protein n=1 Tax=Frondihabitans sucicola TaxID=1268041 RepID=A0ABM8GT43_9MICO|nr:helix-turn-helix domain-containing protein [Frondihabitans sucicola]BDZ51463.1 hypothetical protein GCM10025867_37040 [Frondihabitans sucicola]